MVFYQMSHHLYYFDRVVMEVSLVTKKEKHGENIIPIPINHVIISVKVSSLHFSFFSCTIYTYIALLKTKQNKKMKKKTGITLE